MQRTNIIRLKPNKNQKKILKELMLLSSCVYNSTNYVEHRDIIGATNILTKIMYGSDWISQWKSIHGDETIPLEVSA